MENNTEFTKEELITIGMAVGTICNDMLKEKHPEGEKLRKLFYKINTMIENERD